MITDDPCVDLSFHISGVEPLWSDHRYSLYGAISRVLPQIHQPNEIAVLPISGQQIGGRRMQLTKTSRLTLRVVNRRRAKSWDTLDGAPPESIYLPNHLADVVVCSHAIVDATGAFQLNAFGIESKRLLPRFRKLVSLAAACHDLGKANSQFQKLVSEARPNIARRQAVRHEGVSWYILQVTGLDEWIKSHLDEAT